MAAPQSTPAMLIDPAELQRLQGCILSWQDRNRRKVNTPLQGSRRSIFKGYGMELFDLRPYQRGDDIRHIDWRATARRGRPFSKLFVEERNRHLCLAVDRSLAMQFGTTHEIKMATAARCAALLAFAALSHGEQVSGLLLEQGITHFPACRTQAKLFPLLAALCARPPAGHDSRRTAEAQAWCAEALRTLRPGTTLCMLSGFHDPHALPATLLQRLGQQFETVFVRIRDRAEEQLPDAGLLRLRAPGGQRTVLIDSSDETLRQRYQDTIRERDATFRQRCHNAGIATLTVYNDRDVFAQLEALL